MNDGWHPSESLTSSTCARIANLVGWRLNRAEVLLNNMGALVTRIGLGVFSAKIRSPKQNRIGNYLRSYITLQIMVPGVGRLQSDEHDVVQKSSRT